MNKDDARKLMSGYAMGSLTEAERKALFQAALEDQELFDELAGEHAVKEVLDEPGARQRLLAALEPRRHRAWLWVTAGATVAVALVIGIVVSSRTPPPPQQIAQVMKSPAPVAAPLAPPPPPPVRRKVAPESPVPPPTELKNELQKEEALTDRLQEARPQAANPRAAGAVREFATAALPLPNQFSFSYTVRTDRSLEIVPAAPGFLSVNAGDTIIFPSSAVSAGMPVRVSIAAEVTSVVIGFSAIPGITGTPVRRDGASGTVTDQDPPNSRILIQLFLTPATQ